MNQVTQLSSKFFSSIDNVERSKFILSISGGVDSMVLLNLLSSIKKVKKNAIYCVHINHHLRIDSDQDEQLVKSVCKERDVPLAIYHLDPSKKKDGQSIEEWGRDRRYKILEKVRQEQKAHYILTAHHANDQAETILMHLSQGAGPNGLSGISQSENHILRPLLEIPKNEIIQYAKDYNIEFRDDFTNHDIKHPRNHVRSKVIPALENVYPNVVSQLERSAKLFAQYDGMVNYFVNNELKNINIIDVYGVKTISKRSIQHLPMIAQIMIIRKISDTISLKWRKHHWEECEHFLSHGETGHIYQLASDVEILNDRDHWKIRDCKSNYSIKSSVEIGSQVDYDNFSLSIKTSVKKPILNQNPNHEIIDASAILGKKLEIRNWAPSDIFQPLGMTGKQKVSDFLINRKVDRFEKDRQCVLTADNEIVWVCGRQISHNARITSNTQNTINLKIDWKV